MSDLEVLERRLHRERAARKEAEQLLEHKSRELYETNQRLRELADQTESIVETAAEGIVTYDQHGVIQSLNRAARSLFDHKIEIGSDIRTFFRTDARIDAALFLCVPPQEHDKQAVDLPRAIPEPLEVVGLRAEGNTFPCELSLSCSSHGTSIAYTALIRDLSRRKMLESRLSQAQKMESVGQLAAGIAHEINTPIQFIGNNIQFLKGAFDDLGELLCLFDQLVSTVKNDPSTSDLLQKIDQQSELVDLPFLREEVPEAVAQSLQGIARVSTIVRAMKEFSQPASEEKSSLDINRAIKNALAVSANLYRDIATVETAFDDSIRPLVCLSAQMNQVLLNIISNACEAIADHCQPGTGRISISTNCVGDSAEIRIQDNGPGIPVEIKERIFDPFFTTKEVGKGTGQGLAFVYDVIVNKHDGSVFAHSQPEGGTTFIMTIPLPQCSEATRRQHANSTS